MYLLNGLDTCFSHSGALFFFLQSPQDKATFNSHDIIIEPCHEKTGLLPIYENKGGDICAVTDQSLCFRYTDSTIPLLPRSETSSFYPCPVAVKAGNPEDRFPRGAAQNEKKKPKSQNC